MFGALPSKRFEHRFPRLQRRIRKDLSTCRRIPLSPPFSKGEDGLVPNDNFRIGVSEEQLVAGRLVLPSPRPHTTTPLNAAATSQPAAPRLYACGTLPLDATFSDLQPPRCAHNARPHTSNHRRSIETGPPHIRATPEASSRPNQSPLPIKSPEPACVAAVTKMSPGALCVTLRPRLHGRCHALAPLGPNRHRLADERGGNAAEAVFVKSPRAPTLPTRRPRPWPSPVLYCASVSLAPAGQARAGRPIDLLNQE